MSLLDVSEEKMKRIHDFLSVLEGGTLADAVMSLVVAYQQRGVEITHQKGKLSRFLEQRSESS